jgi:maleate isomerase
VDAAEHRYFSSAGLDVRGGAHLNISDGFRLAEPEPATLFRLGLDGWDESAEALVMTCLNTRSHTVIAALEQAIGKPVITSTQATLWHVLRLAGIKDAITGFGRLLQEH